MSEQCRTCRFYRVRADDTTDGWTGYCVRFPPSIPLKRTSNDGWPNVHGQSWCGEFMEDKTDE